MVSIKRFSTFALCLFGFLLPLTPALASSIDILDGATRVGTLQFTVDPYANESAYFTTIDPYRNLMSDFFGRQFRFFQVIYYDDEPVTWFGNIITPAATTAHVGTLVDVPAGGWDYEIQTDPTTRMSWRGDDFSPFYESDTASNAAGQSYAFPQLSYPAQHTADAFSPGRSLTQDGVGLSRANHRTLLETYLAFLDPALSASRTFDILGGYSWGVQTSPLDLEFGISPTAIPFNSIDSAKLQELQGALGRSGFGGANAWTVQAVPEFFPLDSLNPSPEPGPAVMILSGIVLILVRRLLTTWCNHA